MRSVQIISLHDAGWESDSFESQSQINSLMTLWRTDKLLCLIFTEQSFMDEKIFTASIRVAFFTTILTIPLLFLQIIVLRAHIKGCQFISDSIKLYFLPSWLICVWFTVIMSIIHLLSSWSTNRWNMTFYSLFLIILSTPSIFYLPSSSSKVDGVHLRSTGPRCRFQLYSYPVQLIVPQDGLLGIEHSTTWVWLSDNSTSVSFSMVLCPNGPLTANLSNWEKRRKGREERKKIKRFFSMEQWIWTIDKCCYIFRNLEDTV